MEKKNVARTNLLSIQLREKQGLSKVEIKKVVIPVNGKAEYHLHPCPVVGHIVSGTLLFQIEGEKPQLIKAGEAFYEPKNKPILHFDNALDSEPLVFMAYYLAYIIHSGFISGYQNRYGDNLKPPTNVYHRMTA